MQSNLKKLREMIRELIRKELAEASVTGNIDGGEGPPKTPYAFRDPKDDDKDQKVFVLMKEDDIEEYNTGLTQIGHISEFDVSRGHPVLKTTTVDSIFKELDGNLYKPFKTSEVGIEKLGLLMGGKNE